MPSPIAAPPVVLVTCGDPAGIGPEIAAAAWADPRIHRQTRLRLVADAELVGGVWARRGLAVPPLVTITAADPRPSRPDELLLVASGGPCDPAAIPDAAITAGGGRAAAAAVETAARLVCDGLADALVTGPLHKEALHAAGYDVPGHTELLARGCGLAADAVSMMLWLPPAEPGRGDGLGVVHVTLHESLRSALGRLTSDGIAAAGGRLAAGLTPLLGRRPRVAIAALNPHGGEGGLFGDEETRIVAPAVARLVAGGIEAAGPLPADTLFLRASRGEFDGVVALYHDQGHIPIKLLGMHRAVNVTLGLPFVRTSVAHGTAFDIVGTGRADPAGLVSAIDAAVRLAAAPKTIRDVGGTGPGNAGP